MVEPWTPLATQIQDSVHYLGACGDDWTKFVAVAEFCGGGAVVADQTGDLLDGYAVRRHQGDECVAQVPRRPVCAEASFQVKFDRRAPSLDVA